MSYSYFYLPKFQENFVYGRAGYLYEKAPLASHFITIACPSFLRMALQTFTEQTLSTDITNE